MALSDRPAERHRQVAGLFTERVRGTRSWDAPSPVAGWAARDVVRHLTGWFPGFLASGAGIELPRGPSADQDPMAAWQVHCDGVQAVLDDPETANRELANPHIGRLPLAARRPGRGARPVALGLTLGMHTWPPSPTRLSARSSPWMPRSGGRTPNAWTSRCTSSRSPTRTRRRKTELGTESSIACRAGTAGPGDVAVVR